MSPRSKEQFEHIKDERRERLLEAALKVYSRRGLAATKIEDVATEAGMSHGLVYHYFKSKDEIFTELVRRAVQGSSEMLLQMEQLPLEPLEKLREIARQTLRSIEESSSTAYYFFLMIQACVTDAVPEQARVYMAGSGLPTEITLRIVREGQRAGQLRQGDASEAVTTFWAAVQGLAVYKIAMGERFHVPDGELLTRMFEKPGAEPRG